MSRGARRALWGLVAGLGLAVCAYLASPLVSLVRLGAAIEARDLEAIRARVDFPRLRGSLSRQILQAHLEQTGKAETLGGLRGQVVVGVGASLADPLVEQLLNPEALVAVLDGRLPAGLAPAPAGAGGAAAGEPAFGTRVPTRAWDILGRFSFVTPWEARVAGEGARSVGLRLRFQGFGWRLVGLDLPPALRADLARRLARS